MDAPIDPLTRQRPRLYSDEQVSRFLTRVIFCMFASDVGLLPSGILTHLVDSYRATSLRLAERMQALFKVMQAGGDFGTDKIPYFDGGLFSDDEALRISSEHVDLMRDADQLDWSEMEPSIFGTLFERALDPKRRKQVGAHYTSRSDIELIVRPVLMEPLERNWSLLEKEVAGLRLFTTGPDSRKRETQARGLLQGFLDLLAAVTVLDPACGSGNFLYVSLALLKGLEQQVLAFAASWGIVDLIPAVHPRQLHGIETDPYAHELASMVVWIGYLQWKRKNGISFETETPILEPLSNVIQMDAILDLTDLEHPTEPPWPHTDVIVGNPPFLGGKRLRRELGDHYVDALFHVWNDRVRRESDLCCYWFEKARAMIQDGQVSRVGLLATQAIRGGANRDSLKRIKETGDIFFGVSDQPWILEGAAVHVSMVGFDNGRDSTRLLDGKTVPGINANLTGTMDLTSARRLRENLHLAFMGDSKVGPFDIPLELAATMLARPNPDGRANSDVVRPWLNGLGMRGAVPSRWIVDFPPGTKLEEAALYEAPFEYINETVRPMRADARSGDRTGVPWWIHQRPRTEMRAALEGLDRYIALPDIQSFGSSPGWRRVSLLIVP